MALNKDRFGQVRRKIESAIEHAEEERRRKLLNYRVDLARNGILAYQKGQIAEAVRSFQGYIKILEETKNVGEGGLVPSSFDVKKETAELMMISGVYWDLVKIYDHARSIEKQKEFHHYLEKYIVFSKGLPYQALCAESLRKYINNRKPIHRNEFKNAYEVISVTKCFVASSFVDVCASETLPILREFRDQFLKQHRVGRNFIRWYYRNGPKIASQTNRLPLFVRRPLALGLDLIAILIRNLI